MKTRICMLLIALACMLTALPALAADFSASGLSVSGSAQQLGKPDSYGSAKITADVPRDNPRLDGVSPLTGEPYTGQDQLILANIDTHPRALPHWGVASADIIYELPIQADGSTRSLALFMTEYPDSAGPIRSARVPMASLREMWGGTYCFYGYQGGRDKNNVKEWVLANSRENRFAYPYYLNGMTKNSKWFPRSSDQSHVAPYNVRMDVGAILDDYQATATPHAFLFTDEGLTRGEDVNGVIISYKTTSPAYVTAYQYSDATGLYERYHNGAPYIDGNTGEICAYANVLILRTDVSWASGNPSRPVIRLNGQGVCEIFQNGKYIRGAWVRDCTETKNLGSRMIFLDENGQELPMKTGKTFIQIVDNEQPVVVLADQYIQGSVEPQEQRLTIGAATKTSSPRAKRTPKPTRTPAPTATPEPTAAPTPEPSPDSGTPEQPEAPDAGESQQPEDGSDTEPPQDHEPQNPENVPESDPEDGTNESGASSGNTSESSDSMEAVPEDKPSDSGEAEGAPEDKPSVNVSEAPESTPEEQPSESTESSSDAKSESASEAPPAEQAAAPENKPENNSESQSESKSEESAPAAEVSEEKLEEKPAVESSEFPSDAPSSQSEETSLEESSS